VCLPSAVADDWVKKGCHIHVHGVELTVAPDHQGGVVELSSDRTFQRLRMLGQERPSRLPSRIVFQIPQCGNAG
jgi:hypothetical protein